jgi:hypothetical protein
MNSIVVRLKIAFRSAGSIYAGLGVVLLLSAGLKASGLQLAPAIEWACRSSFLILGSYIAARGSPARPMLHAVTLGSKGVTLGIVEAIVAHGADRFWFSAACILAAMPCAVAGGALVCANRRERLAANSVLDPRAAFWARI